MKEGYFQKKISEFSDKIKTFDNQLSLFEKEFERLQIQLGEFKEFIKKLKDIESYQDQAVKEIVRSNNQHIDEAVEDVTRKVERSLKKSFDAQTALMNQTLDQIKKDEVLFEKSLGSLDVYAEQLQFFQEFHRLFMLKLINKGILNHRELNEVELRAKKRVKQKD